MRVLIDTHVLVWWWTADAELSASGKAILRDPGNEILVSAVSAYEIEFKRDFDPLLQQLPHDLERAVLGDGFSWRAISPADAVAAGRLPRVHRDPWDRLLAAQALAEGLPLVSIDRRLADFGVNLIW